MRTARWWMACTAALAGCVGADAADEAALAARSKEGNFEVWLVDQSNSPGTTFGGRLFVYGGASLMGESAATASAEVIDLGGETAELCRAQTGANPVRAHMVFFNRAQTHAVVAFVASGHVAFLDARTRRPVACLRTSVGAGGARQAHAAYPTPDERHVLVANQNGKLFERIATDYATNTFTLESAATLNLATCTTPSGAACQSPALRPDNAPICVFAPQSAGGHAFVSLRGGGMLVVDAAATPMRIVGEYDRATVRGNGCGFAEDDRSVYFNAGGGTPANLDEFVVYRAPLTGYAATNPPNTPAVATLFDDPSPNRDSHGGVVTRGAQYLWAFDRGGNVVEVLDLARGQRVNTIPLASAETPDPTPDLGVLSPSGNRIFVSLRGPNPLSGDPHSSRGATPGMAVLQVEQNGRAGRVKAYLPISNVDAAGVERADAHAIALRELR